MPSDYARLEAFVHALGAAEAARALGVSYPKLQNWLRRGAPLHALNTAAEWQRAIDIVKTKTVEPKA